MAALSFVGRLLFWLDRGAADVLLLLLWFFVVYVSFVLPARLVFVALNIFFSLQPENSRLADALGFAASLLTVLYCLVPMGSLLTRIVFGTWIEDPNWPPPNSSLWEIGFGASSPDRKFGPRITTVYERFNKSGLPNKAVSIFATVGGFGATIEGWVYLWRLIHVLAKQF